MNKRTLFLMGVLSMSMAVPCLCVAQDRQLTMQLEDLFSIAEQHNSSIKTYESGIEAADAALSSAKTAKLPDLETSLSVSYNGNGRVWDRDFTNGMTAEIPHFGNNATLTASLPIYAGGAIKSGINMAQYGKDMATLDAGENRSNVRWLITGHYLNLHALKNQEKVFDENIALAKDLVDQMEKRRDEGVVLASDVTRYELMLEKLLLGRTKVQDYSKIISHQLSVALGLDTTVVILPDDAFGTEALAAQDEGEWQRLLKDNSFALKKADLAVTMNKEKEKIEKAEMLPHFAVVAEDNLVGPVTIEIPALNNNFNYWYVGLGLKYNFASLYKNNRKVRQAQVETRHSQDAYQTATENLGSAVQAAYVGYTTSLANLRTQQKSVALADENYGVVSNRYNAGIALITDLLDASNEKLDAELGLVSARIEVINNWYRLKYISGTI